MTWSLEQDCFRFLDRLRECGVTNMLGAGVYLQREYGLEEEEARRILVEWAARSDRETQS